MDWDFPLFFFCLFYIFLRINQVTPLSSFFIFFFIKAFFSLWFCFLAVGLDRLCLLVWNEILLSALLVWFSVREISQALLSKSTLVTAVLILFIYFFVIFLEIHYSAIFKFSAYCCSYCCFPPLLTALIDEWKSFVPILLLLLFLGFCYCGSKGLDPDILFSTIFSNLLSVLKAEGFLYPCKFY